MCLAEVHLAEVQMDPWAGHKPYNDDSPSDYTNCIRSTAAHSALSGLPNRPCAACTPQLKLCVQHTVQLTTAAMLPSVAVRKYTAGTSGMGSRGLSSDNVSVTPCRLSSATCRRQDKGWLPLCLRGRWAGGALLKGPQNRP